MRLLTCTGVPSGLLHSECRPSLLARGVDPVEHGPKNARKWRVQCECNDCHLAGSQLGAKEPRFF